MSSRAPRSRAPRSRAPRAPRARAPAPAPVVVAPAPKKKGGLFGKLGRSLMKIARPVADAGIQKLQQMAIAKIAGSGDYAISDGVHAIEHNSIINPTHSDNIPTFSSSGNVFRICHREYIGDLYSSTDFVNTTYTINPANSACFPWLSQIVTGNFQEYRFNGLVFEYKTGSSDALNSTNTALGYVVMSSQYNTLSQPFTTKQSAENTEFAVSTKPSRSMLHAIECKGNPNQPLYVQLEGGQQLSAGDARLYNLATLNVITTGMQQANTNLGELWVSYDILLYRPILQNSLGLRIGTARYRFSQGDSYSWPLGTVQDRTENFDSIGIVIRDDAGARGDAVGNDIVFPVGLAGTYQISLLVDNIPEAYGPYQPYGLNNGRPELVPVLTNATFYNPFLMSTSSVGYMTQQAEGQANGVQSMAFVFCIKITDANVPCVVRFPSLSPRTMLPPTSINGTAPYVQEGNLLITQLNGRISD
nr:putative capsid protein [Crucivirus sp.]